MQTITCDICKKKVDDSLTGRTFFYYARHSVCEPCKDNLELQIKNTIRSKEPFSYDWYEKYVDDLITKAIQRGKN
jgi:hypothetical protein